jgi:hypothetical protein
VSVAPCRWSRACGQKRHTRPSLEWREYSQPLPAAGTRRSTLSSKPFGAPADAGWQAQQRRQAVQGLDLTPAQRLRWLEETLETMRRWLGRAQHGRPNRPDP